MQPANSSGTDRRDQLILKILQQTSSSFPYQSNWSFGPQPFSFIQPENPATSGHVQGWDYIPIRSIKCKHVGCVFRLLPKEERYRCKDNIISGWEDMYIDRPLSSVLTRMRQVLREKNLQESEMARIQLSTNSQGELSGQIKTQSDTLNVFAKQYRNWRDLQTQDRDSTVSQLRVIFEGQCNKLVDAKLQSKLLSQHLTPELQQFKKQIQPLVLVQKLSDASKNLRNLHDGKKNFCFGFFMGRIFISRNEEVVPYSLVNSTQQMKYLSGASWAYTIEKSTRNQYLYCVGGEINRNNELSRSSGDIHCFQLNDAQRKAIRIENRSANDDRFKLFNPAVVIYQDFLHIIGGYTTNNTASQKLYTVKLDNNLNANLKDPAKQKTALSEVDLPNKFRLINPSATIFEKTVYVAGGISPTQNVPPDANLSDPKFRDKVNKGLLCFEANNGMPKPRIYQPNTQSILNHQSKQLANLRYTSRNVLICIESTENLKEFVLFGGNLQEAGPLLPKSLSFKMQANEKILWEEFGQNQLQASIATTDSRMVRNRKNNIVDFEGTQNTPNSFKFMHLDEQNNHIVATLFYLTSKGAKESYYWKIGASFKM